MGYNSLCFDGEKDCLYCDMFTNGYCALLDVELEEDDFTESTRGQLTQTMIDQKR